MEGGREDMKHVMVMYYTLLTRVHCALSGQPEPIYLLPLSGNVSITSGSGVMKCLGIGSDVMVIQRSSGCHSAL